VSSIEVTPVKNNSGAAYDWGLWVLGHDNNYYQRITRPSCQTKSSDWWSRKLSFVTLIFRLRVFSSTSTYHSTDLLTARGVHGTSGSTSYETIPFHTSDWRPLETCCRPWTWWCNDATAPIAGYANMMMMMRVFVTFFINLTFTGEYLQR